MDRLGWGIVGIGSIVRERIAPAIVADERAELVAGVSRSGERAAKFADRFGARAAYTSYEEMLADPGVDAVFIATPNSMHADQVVAAAEAGKHVLCDKPLAIDVAGARKAVESCQAAGVRLGVNFQYRHLPWVREVTRIVEDGRIGRVESVQMQVASGPRRYRNWRTNPEVAGLGSVHNVGVHGLDALGVMLGAEPVEVAAMFDSAPGSGSVEWLAHLALRFSNGALGLYDCNERLANPRNELTVYGTEGRVIGSGLTRSRSDGHLTLLTGGVESARYYPAGDAHRASVEAFTRSVLAGMEPNASGIDGLKSVQLCSAIRRSVEDRTIASVEHD